MPDDLRTRIAKVLSDHDPEGAALCEYHFDLADAVIRELGCYEYAVATADTEFICMYVNERSELDGLQLYPDEQIVRRYVTEWETERDQ